MKAKISSFKIDITSEEIFGRLREYPSSDNDQMSDLADKLIKESKMFLDITVLYQLFPNDYTTEIHAFLSPYLKLEPNVLHAFNDSPCYFLFAICVAEKFDMYADTYLNRKIEKEIWETIGTLTVEKVMDIMSSDIKYQIAPMKIVQYEDNFFYQPIVSNKHKTIIMLESYDFQFYNLNTLYGISDLSLLGVAPIIVD